MNKARLLITAGFLFAVVVSVVPLRPAQAACETAGAAFSAVSDMNSAASDLIQRLVEQEVAEKTTVAPDGTGGYAPNIMRTAYKQLSQYFLDFGENILDALMRWGAEDWLESFKKMTKQLHLAQVQQTHRMGMFMDRQLLVEDKARYQSHINDAYRRYQPSELACQVDSVGPGLSRAYLGSRALNRTLALESVGRHNNARGTPAAAGKAADIQHSWSEYRRFFCDPAAGDPGCDPDLRQPPIGRPTDLPGLLWGPKQTIEPTAENLKLLRASLRYFVDPIAPNAIAATVGGTLQGKKEVLSRRADQTVVNSIYNTLGAMLSERMGGFSGVDVGLMRTLGGVPESWTEPAPGSSPNASYREISEAVTRDRFNDPEYLLRLIGDPAQIAREQGVLGALKLQTMNDIYRRSEEMLFMEAGIYGRTLNTQVPRSPVRNIPLRRTPPN